MKINYLKLNKASVLLLVLLITTLTVSGQQDSQFTQYMYNTQVVNPAYAGNRGKLSLNTLYRSQWAGFQGAPKTLTFSANSPVGEKVGLGLTFNSDQIGPAVENNIAADFSYKIALEEGLNLSFGLKAGLNILNVDFNRLNPDPNQPISANAFTLDNKTSPIIGLGLYLHDSDIWYVGLSAPNLLPTKYYDSNSALNSVASERINFYAIAGYVFDLNADFKLKPAVLVKSVVGAPIAIDLSGNVMFKEKFTLGLAYRLSAAVSGLAGFQITDSIMLGYAYDYETTDIGNFNSGSHELFLRFEFNKKTERLVTPRFF